MQTQTFSNPLTAAIAVGSGVLLGGWSLGISAYLFQKVVCFFLISKIIGCGFRQTIILACCLIQTATAQPANIATNLGAVIPNGGESIKLESSNKSILSVTQSRQPNINLRTELAATLAGICALGYRSRKNLQAV